MPSFTDEQCRDKLKQESNAVASGIDGLPWANQAASVRQDVATIRSSPLIPEDIPVRGFVYDVHSGRLREVVRRCPRGALVRLVPRPTKACCPPCYDHDATG